MSKNGYIDKKQKKYKDLYEPLFTGNLSISGYSPQLSHKSRNPITSKALKPMETLKENVDYS